MAGRQADLVFTDPPYNINYVPEKRAKVRNRCKNPLGGIKNDNLDMASFIKFMQRTFSMYDYVMHDRASIYVFYSRWFSEIVKSTFKDYFKLSSTLVLIIISTRLKSLLLWHVKLFLIVHKHWSKG